MHFTKSQAVAILTFLTSLTTTSAAPFQPNTTLLLPRQVAQAAELIELATAVFEAADSIYSHITDAIEHDHSLESAYTISMIAKLRDTYPDKNAIVFHDQDSTTDFVNGVHSHYELPLKYGHTQGYEIFTFDSGSFVRAGDGGDINWQYGGACTRNGDTHVSCSAPSVPSAPAPAPQTPMVPPQTPTRWNQGQWDGNYLVNCRNRDDGTLSSGLAYYNVLVPGGNVGQQPTDYVDVAHGRNVQWEQPGEATFSSGTTVHWNVFGTAQDADVPVQQAVGTADNGWEHFWVYKDAGEWLYSVGSWDCDSVYWAF